MQRLAKIVFWLGVVSMCYSVVAPPLAWFRMREALGRFGLQQEAKEGFSIYLRDTGPTLAITLIVGLLCVIAGHLILKKKKAGWTLWTILCGVQVVLWFLQVALGEASWALFASGLLWLGLALMTMLAARPPALQSWWTDEHPG